jgi:hypothetical protein
MESRPVTNQYIIDFFEKKGRKNPLMVKTRYGKGLGATFGVNEKKAAEWLADRSRRKSLSASKS